MDIPFDKQSSPVRVVGGGTDNESNVANVSTLKELSTSDLLDNGGADTILTIGTLPVELKVGASVKTDRKTLLFVPLDSGFTFGFSELTQNIPVYKKQMIALNVGDGTRVWAKNTSTAKSMVVAEL